MDIVRIIIVLLHFLFSIFTIFIVLFSNDIITVMTTGLLLYAAFLYNYKCDDCPLSIMEDNYLKISSIDRFFILFLLTFNISPFIIFYIVLNTRYCLFYVFFRVCIGYSQITFSIFTKTFT